MTKHKDKKNDQNREQPKQKPSKSSKRKKTISDEAQAHIDELTGLLRQERADSENMRRRHDAQVSDLKSHVKAEVVGELLPIIDTVERALQYAPEDLKNSEYIKGIEAIAKQFGKTLDKLGVEKIPTVNEPFNPDVHEAVSMDDSSDGKEEIVAEELQAGYKIGERIIRHAMVRVKLK